LFGVTNHKDAKSASCQNGDIQAQKGKSQIQQVFFTVSKSWNSSHSLTTYWKPAVRAGDTRGGGNEGRKKGDGQKNWRKRRVRDDGRYKESNSI
jgi:hypothetical protein